MAARRSIARPTAPGTYVLRGGEQGAQRLRLLARVKWPTTRALLRRAGLRPGMRCLDVGCGNGAVTLQMAHIVGARGWVVGIDADAAILEHARSGAARTRLPVEFRDLDAERLEEHSVYDLVYARFLLTHLRNPERAISRMLHSTRPGGTIVVEDIDFPGHVCYPPCPAFDRYLELYQAVVRRRGGNPAIGPRLPELLLDAGLEALCVDIAQPTFREGEGKLVAQVTMEHIREAVVAAKLASHAEIDAIVTALDAFAQNPRTVMSIARVFQVWGRRPTTGPHAAHTKSRVS